MEIYMDSVNGEEAENSNISVKELQAALFPPIVTSRPTVGGTYYSYSLLSKPSDDGTISEEFIAQTTPSDNSIKPKEGLPFTLIRDTEFIQQPPRWPTECQVTDERIRLNGVPPTNVEHYYIPTGREIQPKPVGEEYGTVVYNYAPANTVNYYCRSTIGGSKPSELKANSLISRSDTIDHTLQFESRFECGNLAKVIKLSSCFYELYLSPDLYTDRHMQWYYFRVTNMRTNYLYRFSIVNFTKNESLYNEGMMPLMHSEQDSKLHSIGWQRCGDNITYYCNDNIDFDGNDSCSQVLTYTLSFTVQFPHDNDIVYLAHSYPYTYSDLEDYLRDLSLDPIKSTFTSINLLCKTISGNNVHVVTITTPPAQISAGEPKSKNKKHAVVLTARVHPGETPSSWTMKGMLDYLTSDCGPAKQLRDNFLFKLIPMLNPDGVIVGNNRCSLAGKDLNRQYRSVLRDAYPSIWYTKLMVRRLQEEFGVAIYCDLHAHSRKHNIFIYGCENRKDTERRLLEQVFPLMLHKNTPDKFCFESCKFNVHKMKEGTGRVVMWMMGITNSYTLEMSFAGSTLMGNKGDAHFTPNDYEQMGRSFCQTLLDYYDLDPRKEKLRIKIVNRLQCEGSSADLPTNIYLTDFSSDEGDETTASSSNESDQEELYYPAVPPPSPLGFKSRPSKFVKRNRQNASKSRTRTSTAKKPFSLRKALLKLSLSQKRESEESDISDCSETRIVRRVKRIKKLRKCRQLLGKSNVSNQLEGSLLNTKPNSSSFDKLMENCQKIVSQRITVETQAKLALVKKKFWFASLSAVPTLQGQTDNSFSATADKVIGQNSFTERNNPLRISDGKTSNTNQEESSIRMHAGGDSQHPPIDDKGKIVSEVKNKNTVKKRKRRPIKCRKPKPKQDTNSTNTDLYANKRLSTSSR